MQWVLVGRFGKAHGLRGLAKVQSFTHPPENILRYPDWHMKTSAGWVPVKLEQAFLQGRSVLAKLEGIDDRDKVIQVTNREIAVTDSVLPTLPEGEYYWFELVGMRVINQQALDLGEVKEIFSTGANDVMRIQGEKEHLVPFIRDQYVLEIDKKERRIRIDWDENF